MPKPWKPVNILTESAIMATSEENRMFKIVACDLAVLSIIALVYLLPAIIADWRSHRHQRVIALFNIILGWTLIGWLIALVWACQDHPKEHGGIGGG